MKAFKIDASGDFIIEKGSFVMVEGDDELIQQIRMSYLTRKGEWFLDEDEGLEREPLFAKFFDQDEAKDAIIESTIGTSESLEYENITFDRDKKTTRKMVVNVNVSKEDGTILSMEGVEI